MSRPRFYIPKSDWSAEQLVLDARESHHCLDVLRCASGDEVVAFDGEGLEVTAVIEEAARGRVTLRREGQHRSTLPSARISLAQAVPKGKNMDLIIQKATELGVAAIFPILSERTVVQIKAAEAGKKREKWQRVAVEACKQCGQNWVPEVGMPVTMEAFLSGDAYHGTDLLLIASLGPAAKPFKTLLKEFEQSEGRSPESALVFIGPEGDFTAAELETASAQGLRPLGLGPIVLRTETAALHCLSILNYELTQ